MILVAVIVGWVLAYVLLSIAWGYVTRRMQAASSDLDPKVDWWAVHIRRATPVRWTGVRWR